MPALSSAVWNTGTWNFGSGWPVKYFRSFTTNSGNCLKEPSRGLGQPAEATCPPLITASVNAQIGFSAKDRGIADVTSFHLPSEPS